MLKLTSGVVSVVSTMEDGSSIVMLFHLYVNSKPLQEFTPLPQVLLSVSDSGKTFEPNIKSVPLSNLLIFIPVPPISSNQSPSIIIVVGVVKAVPKRIEDREKTIIIESVGEPISPIQKTLSSIKVTRGKLTDVKE